MEEVLTEAFSKVGLKYKFQMKTLEGAKVYDASGRLMYHNPNRVFSYDVSYEAIDYEINILNVLSGYDIKLPQSGQLTYGVYRLILGFQKLGGKLETPIHPMPEFAYLGIDQARQIKGFLP